MGESSVGDLNQRSCLKYITPEITGPVLEVGSREEANIQGEHFTVSYRDLFPGCEYIGLDLLPGKDVDVVCDLTEGTGNLPKEYFDLIICCSVLEHVKYPWKFAPNLTSLLKPGGYLFLSVPWVWKCHSYPDDYYRYTPSGVKAIFEDLEWGNFYGSLREAERKGFIRIPQFEGFDTSWGTALGLNYKDGLKPMMINGLGKKDG